MSVWPTEAQIGPMNTSWSTTDVNQNHVPGTIGMYGNAESYYFYMNFRANDADAWWTTATNKNFVLLFQDGKSDTKWRGVKYAVSSTISSASTAAMTSIVVVNSTKDTQYTSAVAAADDAARLTAL